MNDSEPTAARVNRRILMTRYGGPELMTVVEEPLPEPGPGQVRVRIQVAGVGFPDVLVREGTYPRGPRPPFTPAMTSSERSTSSGQACPAELWVSGSALSPSTAATRTTCAFPSAGWSQCR